MNVQTTAISWFLLNYILVYCTPLLTILGHTQQASYCMTSEILVWHTYIPKSKILHLVQALLGKLLKTYVIMIYTTILMTSLHLIIACLTFDVT